MTRAARRARNALGALLVVGAGLGCGQQGPLVLPESARPIERLETPPAQSTPDIGPEAEDDERRNER